MYTIDTLQKTVKQLFEEQNFLFEPKTLYKPIEYSLSQGGKRIRPVLLLAACDLMGGDCQQAYNAAIGVEIFHNFTLLHDDLMDKSNLRRGKETVYRRWNENIAILSGDTMFAMAYQYFLKTPHKNMHTILNVFTETAIDICNGQQYDMNFETQLQVSLEEYLVMIRKKTAVLLAAALEIGALYADASETDRTLLYEFGIQIGMAFQLQDDLLDVYGDEKIFGKQTGTDIKDNKKTFLLLKALELADRQQYDVLERCFSVKYDDNKEKIESVLNVYTALGIKEKTEEEINRYFEKALCALQQISVPNEKKNILQQFVNQLLVREF